MTYAQLGQLLLSSDFEIGTQDFCQVWVPDIEANVGLGLKLKLRQPRGYPLWDNKQRELVFGKTQDN